MTDTLEFLNPDGVHAPAGAYSHAVAIPPNARVLCLSGQIGLRPDGSLGSTVVEQADQAFQNIGAILKANGMSFTDIVKLTTYVPAGQPGADVGVARRKHMGDHRPTATFLYVAQLYAPEWLVEIEAIAVAR